MLEYMVPSHLPACAGERATCGRTRLTRLSREGNTRMGTKTRRAPRWVMLESRAGYALSSHSEEKRMKRCVGLSNRRGSTSLTLIPQIGLPMDRDKVRKLCLLDAFLTGNGLIVTPWVHLPSYHVYQRWIHLPSYHVYQRWTKLTPLDSLQRRPPRH